MAYKNGSSRKKLIQMEFRCKNTCRKNLLHFKTSNLVLPEIKQNICLETVNSSLLNARHVQLKDRK